MSVTAPPALTAAPTSPDRADRTTFSARAITLDDFTKNTQIPQLTQALTNVFNNATDAAASAVTAGSSATIAAASASYKGDWSTLTGALNMPASVSYAGAFWALNANLANVAAVTPGVSASWTPIIYGSIPQNAQSANYTLLLTDAGKHLLHPSADTTARTFTIPSNASVSYPVGTAITFINQASAGNVTIAITTDVIRWSPVGTTGSRTLQANGIATAVKVSATEWLINGSGLL